MEHHEEPFPETREFTLTENEMKKLTPLNEAWKVGARQGAGGEREESIEALSAFFIGVIASRGLNIGRWVLNSYDFDARTFIVQRVLDQDIPFPVEDQENEPQK